ncbi:16894_t:CDS:1, partial [Dentiscutata erythropus]
MSYSNTFTAYVYVLIKHSSDMLGKMFEWDSLTKLRSIGFVQ